MEPTKLNGGSVKIVDSTVRFLPLRFSLNLLRSSVKSQLTHTPQVFNISKTIAVAEVTVQPGAIREMHWHPTQDEWTFFLEGEGRMTVFTSSASNTFNYQGGDVAYIPPSFGEYRSFSKGPMTR